ncbi:thioredoxin domain-containing protein [Desulfococcus sp.]|uniref:thioredoxin domain-containing protein n=1 Tax=Desulfococcus sp. TaxID=2025834 RepID=UPI0035935C17
MSANLLIHEKSPYLLQHAHNPVGWHPWSEAAFRKAREEDKPIFLSIGYATCHWCHVMERESFEDDEAARILNESFVCIKVDREERPDIDAVYMAACQMLSGRGGWPLTILMTPDRRPFFAGTYIPRESRFGQAGLIQLCRHVQGLWGSDRGRIMDAAETVADRLDRAFAFTGDEPVTLPVLNQACDHIGESFDERHGGFNPPPKFPTPHRLMFLMRHHRLTGRERSLDMAAKTLAAMRLGGIWDHVGFGFHRYSTDGRWLLPHFEKMLYDQALLAMAYLEAHQATGDAGFARTAHEIFTYVLRDMTAGSGGFFTAEDADSEGEDGKFYVWTTDELDEVLGPDEAGVWREVLSFAAEGNFSEEAGGRRTGANIPHLTRPLASWAETLAEDEAVLASRWEAVRQRMFAHREKRVHPLKDDKILTDWNGLMIAAFAAGARILGKPEYAGAAGKAFRFIEKNLLTPDGRLLHRYRDGEAGIAAQADDYAFLVWGLLELHGATADPAHLEWAVRLQKQMVDDFWDGPKGGFFLTAATETDLPVRPKALYDGAIPSANSVSLANLTKLFRLTADDRWAEWADLLSRAFSGSVKANPQAFTCFLMGAAAAAGGQSESNQ